MTPTIFVPVSPGELIDKITILRIKLEHLNDPQLQNVRRELELLTAAQAQTVASSVRLTELARQPQAVNAALWDIEDAPRLCERNGEFGPRFIELARSVYRHNDRARLPPGRREVLHRTGPGNSQLRWPISCDWPPHLLPDYNQVSAISDMATGCADLPERQLLLTGNEVANPLAWSSQSVR
jgi:hypothetical protein